MLKLTQMFGQLNLRNQCKDERLLCYYWHSLFPWLTAPVLDSTGAHQVNDFNGMSKASLNVI